MTLTDTEKNSVKGAVKHAQLITKARIILRAVKTEHPSPESLVRRALLEPDDAAWLRYYMPDTFPDPWGADHIEMLLLLGQCMRDGGSFCVLIARGGGKSAIGKGCAVKAGITGLRKYIVPIGATDKLALEYLEFAKNQLDGDNERIAEDYPEAVGFFKALDGKPIKAYHQLDEKMKRTGIRWGAQGLTYPTVHKPDGVTLYPFSGCRMECRGITSAMKGMAKTIGGRIIRPDFVLPDDVQTEDDALSDAICAKIENKILGTVLALAGPRKRIACFMPMTKVRCGDVACRFSDRKQHPEFQGKRYPMLSAWPDAQDTLWARYADIRKEAESDAQGKREATAFYVEHRAEMDDGARVSWESRIRAGEISALETAENLLIELGMGRFMAEMQQDPIEEGAGSLPYRLTEAIVLLRTDAKRPPFAVPDWCLLRVGSTDLNPSYGFSSAVVGFGADQTAAIPWYGIHRTHIGTDIPDADFHRLLFAALVAHGKEIAALPCRPDVWHIDAGGKQFPTVLRFVAECPRLCGLQAFAATGTSREKYRPFGKAVVGQPREYCHMRSDIADGRRRLWIARHKDYWLEVSQRAWLEIGRASCRERG